MGELMPRYQTTLSVSAACVGGEGEFQVEVAYDVTWGCEAQTYGPPENCHPAEPDEVDGVSLLTVDGVRPLPDLADAVSTWIQANALATLIEDAAQQADDGPDPDDARDQAFDNALHERDLNYDHRFDLD